MSTCFPCMEGDHQNCGRGNRVDMWECRCDGRTPDCPGQVLQRSGCTFDQAVAVDRIKLARQALIADGYFTADEVGDDVAPRIWELSSHLRHRIENLENRIGAAATLYWECATCMDSQRSYHLTRPCADGNLVECEACNEPMRLMMTQTTAVPDVAVAAALSALDFRRKLAAKGYSKAQVDVIAAGIMRLAETPRFMNEVEDS